MFMSLLAMKTGMNLKYYKGSPKDRYDVRPLGTQEDRTWGTDGWKATVVTVSVCPDSLWEKVLEPISYTYAWKTEPAGVPCGESRQPTVRDEVCSGPVNCHSGTSHNAQNT